jgi:hypothetical protein
LGMLKAAASCRTPKAPASQVDSTSEYLHNPPR